MPNWKKVIVSGSDAVLNTVTASAGFFGTASWATNATSASFARTASFVNTLNQDVLISGSLTVGAATAGASENTLTLGPKGTNEGGQLGFQAGTSATSASMLDMYQDGANPYFRLLRGSNATSDAVVAQWNTHTKQMFLPTYNSPTAFTGTPAAYLAVDTNGAIITTSGSGGSGLSGGSTNYIARWASSILLTTGSLWDNGTNVGVGNQSPSYKLDVSGDIRSTGAVYANANGAMYFRGGDDAELWDINTANTVGIYGQQDQGVASIKLGSGGGTISGRSGSIGIGTTTPNSGALHVSGNIWATSLTGSLQGTASYATMNLQQVTNLGSTTTNDINVNSVNVWDGANSEYVNILASDAGLSASSSGFTFTVQSDNITFGLVGTRLATLGTGLVTGNKQYELPNQSGTIALTTGSIFGTASWAVSASQATSASFASTASFAPNYVLTSATASMLSPYVLTSQTSSMSVATASLALRASGSLTGSLLGTASWATNAVTAITAANATNVSITGDNSGTAFTLPLILGTTGTGQTLYVDSTPAVLYTPSTNQLWASNLQATGSLFGTASWANNATTANTASYVLNAVSSSFASTASFVATASWADRVVSASGNNSTIQYNSGGILAGSSRFQFNGSNVQFGDGGNRVFGITGSLSVIGNSILTGSSVITGSLIVSGSTNGIDTVYGALTTNLVNKVDWTNGGLSTDAGINSVDWQNFSLNDSSSNPSVDWTNRYLIDSSAVNSVEWEGRILRTPAGNYFNWANDYYTTSNIYHSSTIRVAAQDALIDSATPAIAGQIIRGTVHGSVTNGYLVFLDTDGVWYNSKNTNARGVAMLGICVNQPTGEVLVEGDVGVSDNNMFGTYVISASMGSPVYIGENDGELITTQPTSGVVRTVGHIYFQSTTTANYWLMKFRPSNDWYEQ